VPTASTVPDCCVTFVMVICLPAVVFRGAQVYCDVLFRLRYLDVL
jgi:hypothetical protein